MSAEIELSVVISTCGRLKGLTGVLEGLAACEGAGRPGWEVIVIDNRPAKITEGAVRSFSDKLPIRYVGELRSGSSHARNRGVVEAQGEAIWFLDDDLRLTKDWLSAAWAAVREHPDAGFFGGRIVPDWGNAKLPKWFGEEVGGHASHIMMGGNNSLSEKSRIMHPQEAALEANMGVRKHLFCEVGGFRTDMGPSAKRRRGLGEGPDLLDRLREHGTRGYFSAEAVVHHLNNPDRLSVRYALLWSYTMGRFSQKRKALYHVRKGRYSSGYCFLEVARNGLRVLSQTPFACTVCWFVGARRRVGSWMVLARSVGRLVETLAVKPDLQLDWPEGFRQQSDI